MTPSSPHSATAADRPGSRPPAIVTHIALKRLIKRIARRWHLRSVLEHFIVSGVVLLALALLAVALMILNQFDESVVATARTGFYLAAVFWAIYFLTVLHRRRGIDQVVHYAESQTPEHDALLLSAVEAHDKQHDEEIDRLGVSRQLTERLVDDAVVQFSQAAKQFERRRLTGAVMLLVLLVAGGAYLWHQAGAPWRHGLSLMMLPKSDPSDNNPFALQVVPGDTVVVEGDDERIGVTAEGFNPNNVTLVSRVKGAVTWRHAPMAASEAQDQFESFLFNVADDMEYYAEAGKLRSDVFTVSVVERPVVEQIDLRYEFPVRTGRPAEEVLDGGDIRAVIGTNVVLGIQTNVAVDDAELVIDNTRRIAFERVGDTLQANLLLAENGHYHIELPINETRKVVASQEHIITALIDDLPAVSVAAPGRDTRATSIEEIELAVTASDDVALNSVELVMSFNGGGEEVIALNDANGESVTTQIDAAHMLYLEERDLVPGDLVAYYARAKDADDSKRQVATDIYFIDIRPFDKRYKRGAGGGGGGNQGGQSEQALSAQQRALVVALFKVTRDLEMLSPEIFDERTNTLTEAQRRIRTRAQAIVTRLNARQIVNANPAYQQMAEELPKAVAAMDDVVELLDDKTVDQALPAARKALSHLQRADAAIREVRVSQSRSQQGADAAAEELSDLFRLEMDKFRNQYADLQRGQTPQQRQQQLDETLRKLQELARRQQQEIERAKQRSLRGQSGAASQRQLAEQLEALVRELERLTRQRQQASPSEGRSQQQASQTAEADNPSPSQGQSQSTSRQGSQSQSQGGSNGQSGRNIQESLEQLTEAARNMRESAQSADSSASRRALDQLRQAQRALRANPSQQLTEQLDEAQRNADEAANEQARISASADRTQANADGDERASQSRGATGDERIDAREMDARKRMLAENTRNLQNQLEELDDELRQSNVDAANAIAKAIAELRDKDIAERIESSRRALDNQDDSERATAAAGAGDDTANENTKTMTPGSDGDDPDNATGPVAQLDAEEERAIAQAFNAARDHVAEAVDSAQGSAEERRAQAANRLRAMLRDIAAESRSQGGAERNAQSATAQSPSQQPGQSPSSSPNNAIAQGGDVGNATGGDVGRYYRNSGSAPRLGDDVAREWRRQARTLADIADTISDVKNQAINGSVLDGNAANSDIAQDIRGLIAAIGNLEGTGDGDVEITHQQFLNELRRIERALRDGEGDGVPDIVAVQRALTPEGQESMVERYFRQLSDSRQTAGE